MHPAGDPDQAGAAAQPDAHAPARRWRPDPGRRDDVLLQVVATPGSRATGRRCPAALKTNPMMAVMNAPGLRRDDSGQPRVQLRQRGLPGHPQAGRVPAPRGQRLDDGRLRPRRARWTPGRASRTSRRPWAGSRSRSSGITNHRVPNYELPEQHPRPRRSRTRSPPAKAIAPKLEASNDVVIALTHIGFTDEPEERRGRQQRRHELRGARSPGVDAIVGSHSHTNPASPEAPYKFLPTIVAGPGQRAGDHQPGLPLQQHARRGRHRRARQGRRRLRGRQPGRAVPHR